MITIVLFIFAMVGFAYWWLWRQRVLEKPWTEVGPEADTREEIVERHRQPKQALRFSSRSLPAFSPCSSVPIFCAWSYLIGVQ